LPESRNILLFPANFSVDGAGLLQQRKNIYVRKCWCHVRDKSVSPVSRKKLRGNTGVFFCPKFDGKTQKSLFVTRVSEISAFPRQIFGGWRGIGGKGTRNVCSTVMCFTAIESTVM